MTPKTPKQTFLEHPESKVFAELATQRPLLLATEYAFMELLNRMPPTSELSLAAANHLRMEGARTYRTIFLTLADVSVPRSHDRGDNLPNSEL